jgi:hypothetical protein
MIGETSFPLQIENELPDFILTDLSSISISRIIPGIGYGDFARFLAYNYAGAGKYGGT